MQSKPHLKEAQDMLTQDTPIPGECTTSVGTASSNMYYDSRQVDVYSMASSGTTTPMSDRSSLSNESSVSSISTTNRPHRSSLKPSLKSNPSTEFNNYRRSSPPTVRFAEPEWATGPKSLAPKQRQKSHPQRNGIPNPLLQYQHRPGSMVSSSASSRFSARPQAYSTLPPHIVSTPQSRQIQYQKARSSQRFSAPVQPSQFGPRQSAVRSPTNFTPPSLALEHRVSSFQSVASDHSTQSAPAILQSPLTSTPAGPFNPLLHYVPCLHADCTVHFASASLGPTYYLPQGPYSLSKHHGYCPHHASKELKEANAWCKRNWESLRQNAGRKTLGQIASEFDVFLDTFRQNRRLEDADLQRRQKRVILGTDLSSEDTKWKWMYTPRHCTRSGCPSGRYSPFANHLYAFYHTRRPSTFTALINLCSSCARNEVEAFERLITEKWASRCGWDEREWNEWFEKVVQDREMGKEFWEKAQDREVRERKAGGMEPKQKLEGRKAVRTEEKQVEKKKSVFKRLFGVGKGGE